MRLLGGGGGHNHTPGYTPPPQPREVADREREKDASDRILALRGAYSTMLQLTEEGQTSGEMTQHDWMHLREATKILADYALRAMREVR